MLADHALDGGLRRIERTDVVADGDARDAAVSPDGRMLYVPNRGSGRVVGYPIGDDGAPAREFVTCVQGPLSARYQQVVVNGSRLYVSRYAGLTGGSGRIDVFGIAPDGTLSGADGIPLGPEACQRDASGVRPDPTTPLSSRKKLADPKSFIKGNKMVFPGIKRETEVADLIAYLKDATK